MTAWEVVAEVPVDPDTCSIYVEGWQSWSPSGVRRLADPASVPADPNVIALGYRADRPPGMFHQGEGLLAVAPQARSEVHLFAGTGPESLPSIRAVPAGAVLRIEADGPVVHRTAAVGVDAALADWAHAFAHEAGLREIRPAPTVWCSWYQYFTDVTAGDILENVAAMDRLDLPIDVVQIDDGYEREIGDWLHMSGRFDSLRGIADLIRGHGRRAGIWVAPFLVGERSELAERHPRWLVPDIDAGQNWGQRLRVLDVTHPEAAQWLGEVFATLRATAFDYFKIDFCYAGALAGRRHEPMPALAAYRVGLALIREAIGDAYLVGCGAPTLGSVGMVDAMRVGPDTAAHYEPTDGDLSQPGQRSAEANGRARSWQHGRFWVNDPDCLIARPAVERREEWASHVERFGGLRASSDRLTDLDAWGLATTRRLLSSVPPPVPFA